MSGVFLCGKIIKIKGEIYPCREAKRPQQKTAARKARDHRLCKRGAYLESIVPDTIALTDQQFYQFLDKTLKTERTAQIMHNIKTQHSGAAVGVESSKTAQGMNSGNAAGSSDNKQEKAG